MVSKKSLQITRQNSHSIFSGDGYSADVKNDHRNITEDGHSAVASKGHLTISGDDHSEGTESDQHSLTKTRSKNPTWKGQRLSVIKKVIRTILITRIVVDSHFYDLARIQGQANHRDAPGMQFLR